MYPALNEPVLNKNGEHNSVSEDGFSLLEVVIALAIFALAFGGLSQMSDFAIKRSHTMSSRLEALTVAQSLMEEALAAPDLAEGNSEGRVTAPSQLSWQRSVEVYEEGADPRKTDGDKLLQITIEVEVPGAPVVLQALKRQEGKQ